MATTIQSEWQDFEKLVVPKDATPVQREECQRAFYAGASAIFGIVSVDIPALPDDEGVRVLEALHQELRAYLADFTKRFKLKGH